MNSPEQNLTKVSLFYIGINKTCIYTSRTRQINHIRLLFLKEVCLACFLTVNTFQKKKLSLLPCGIQTRTILEVLKKLKSLGWNIIQIQPNSKSFIFLSGIYYKRYRGQGIISMYIPSLWCLVYILSLNSVEILAD